MALADSFQQVLDSLSDDWTDLELDLRLSDEERYIDAAVLLTQVNAQPYSKAEWHLRLLVAHRFGHAAAAETVKGILALLDREGIDGELVVRDVPRAAPRSSRCGAGPRACARSFAVAAACERRRGRIAVARILAVAPDLMFASRIEATLGAAATPCS